MESPPIGHKSKIFIIGAQGLVGENLTAQLDEKRLDWEGTFYKRENKRLFFLDITQEKQVQSLLEKIHPTVTVFCANHNGGVAFCEKNPKIARKFHYECAIGLARACREQGSRFIFLSTECVFDGEKEIYSEGDLLSPVNIYGKCKAETEKWIQENMKDYAIIRTMFVFGWQPETVSPNALMNIYRAVSQNKEISVPAYRWGTPTFVHDLAKAIAEIGLSDKTGIYHVAGTTFLNRYEWAKKSCAVLGWNGDLLIPQDKPTPREPPYPQKIKLDTTKFRSEFRTRLHSLEESLLLLKEEINAK